MTALIPTPASSSALTVPQASGSASSDHASLHTTVARAAAGAALGGLAAHGMAAFLGNPMAWLTFGVTVGGLAAVAARWRSPKRALAAAGIAALGTAGYLLTTGVWAPLGALVLGVAAAPILARGASWRRLALTGVLAGIGAHAGLFAAEVLLGSGVFQGLLPGALATMTVAGAAGLFLGLASAPKHLVRAADPVELAFRPVGGIEIEDGEVREILARALAVYVSVRDDVGARSEDDASVQGLTERVRALMMRILEIAEHCRQVDRDLGATPLAELDERIANLKQKADATQDETARRTYERTAQSLEEQRRSHQAISRGRERVVARLHGNLALLERLRFSLLHARSAHTERAGEGLFPLADAIEELSRELDVTSAAVGEVYGPTTSLALESSPPGGVPRSPVP